MILRTGALRLGSVSAQVVLRFFRFGEYWQAEVTMSTPREITVLPARDTDALDKAMSILAGDHEVRVTGSGDRAVSLPIELRDLLTTVVTAMRRGQAVTLAPVGQQLTTQQAADLLGISRPTLIKLLETGRIPYETPGRHRRIRLSDLLAYREARRGEQRQALRDLAEEAQALDLYDRGIATFEAALAESRAKRA